MKKIRRYLAVLLSICACAPTGGVLAQQADEKADFAWFIQLVQTHNGKEFCAPDKTTVNQLTASVAAYLKAHGTPSRVTDSEVIEALSESYPCRASSAPVASRIDGAGHPATVKQLPCLDLLEANHGDTPADLYASVRKCIDQGEFERATRLFALAGVYARFDAERVADPTAKGTGKMLILATMGSLTPDAKKRFDDAFNAMTADRSTHRRLCTDIGAIGPPAYFPSYMVAHGMGVITGATSDTNALLPNFNAGEAWSTLQTTYLMCGK